MNTNHKNDKKKLEFDAGTFFIIKYNSTAIKRSFSHSFQYLYTTYNRYNVLNYDKIKLTTKLWVNGRLTDT